MNNDYLPEDDLTSTSTLVEDFVEEFDDLVEPTGPCCEKCGTPIPAKDAIACRKCGWYASVGIYVEIDNDWEAATDPTLAIEAEDPDKPKEGIPSWGWILGGCIVAVVVESLLVSLLAPSVGSLRTVWSLSQLFLGFVSFIVCHTIAFVILMKNEAEVKFLDYILRPIHTWSMIFRDLPQRGYVCYVGLSGLVAVAMAMLVIGGIPYERLLDWNIQKKAKFNLMGAVMEQAQNLAKEDEKSLEEAIGDFAGKAELDEEEKKKQRDENRPKEDCVIIGYMANQAGEIQTLFLAAEHFAKLAYAGSVRATDLPEEQRLQLAQDLAEITSHRPFVRLSIDGAVWVKPKYLCRVSYRRRGKQGGLYGAKIEDMLGEVQLGGTE